MTDSQSSARTPHYQGLTAAQVEASRAANGTNVLTPPEREPAWKQFLAKFSDPLIVILMVAGFLSIGISFYEYYVLHDGFRVFFEPIGIFVAILLATGMAFLFEQQANREFSLLNKVNDEVTVLVVRDGGRVTKEPRRDVVVGDIVILSTGDEVPADGCLLRTIAMQVDESTLTGEPICAKSADPAQADPEATFPTNHVMRGTKVMEGHGVMEVTAVGDSTEHGRVYRAAQIDNSVRTPLNEQLDRLGRLISIASYVIGIAIVVGRMLVYFIGSDFDWIGFIACFLQSIMIAVTLIVVAVPEGLPMAVTLSLAYSMRRMLKTNNLVRRLHACETMGATTVICTDKTGTLTQNRMQLAVADFVGLNPEHLDMTSAQGRRVAEAIAINSTAQLDTTDAAHPTPLGNPTEGALLLWLNRQGVNYSDYRIHSKVAAELPFSTERKFMATLVEDGSSRRLYVKGAPEIVLAMCSDVANIEELNAKLAGWQNRGMRTLAFATAQLDGDANPIRRGAMDPVDLKLLGVVAISDPVRADVPDAVAECRRAGIEVKIVTGDTPATAREIGRQIGLNADLDAPGAVITGPDFAEIPDEQLPERVKDIAIIARARPMDKKRLVEALQKAGQVVAVTGDGTNDAPALKQAHVGLSMGDGTSVAKEASDITIIDNSFASIARAVMWGRSLYRNIQRFILFQLTVNVVACLTVLIGAFVGLQSPLTVTQMLWVNLIMDTFAAMALASLPPESSVMNSGPRSRHAFIITRPMWRFIIGTGLAFTAVMLALLWRFHHIDIDSVADIFTATATAASHDMTPYELSLFFTIFVFLQFWNMFNARAFATGRSALRLRGCGGFLFIVALIFVGQIAIVSCGGELFNVVALRFTDWLWIIATTSAVLWVGELWRAIRR